MLVILDLDETLIHARDLPLSHVPDFRVFEYVVYRRPHLAAFLETMFAHFDVAVWSSASDDYVRAVVDEIFPDPDRLKFVWGRSRCTYEPIHADRDAWSGHEGVEHFQYVKKLSKLRRRGYDLKQTLIVDDTPRKCRHNYGNAIYTQEWNGSPEDDELFWLARYILTLKDVPNVRNIEKRRWRPRIIAASKT